MLKADPVRGKNVPISQVKTLGLQKDVTPLNFSQMIIFCIEYLKLMMKIG